MSSKRKILIVDDELIGRQLLQAILFPLNHNLLFAVNGKEAVSLTLAQMPDLILLDVMMPEIDGIEVCRQIKSDKSTQNIPVILITALDDRDSRLKGLEAGANDYISKPYDRNEIVAKVKNLFLIGSGERGREISENQSQTDKPETPVLGFVNKLAASSPDYIKKSFKGFFSVALGDTRTISLIGSASSKILFCANNPDEKIAGTLCSMFIRKVTSEIENTAVTELFEQLVNFIRDDLSKQFSIVTESNSFEFILCSVGDTVQFAGMNQVVAVISENGCKLLELKNFTNFTRDELRENVLSLTKAETGTIYFTNHPFIHFVQTEKSIMGMYGGFENYLIQLSKQDIQHQEKQINYLVEKAARETKLKNAALAALKF